MRYTCGGDNSQYTLFVCPSCGRSRRLLNTLLSSKPACAHCGAEMDYPER